MTRQPVYTTFQLVRVTCCVSTMTHRFDGALLTEEVKKFVRCLEFFRQLQDGGWYLDELSIRRVVEAQETTK